MQLQEEGGPSRREGHGWWPYCVPYFAFLATVQIAGRMPESWGPALLLVKPAVPAAFLVYYARKGAYAELRGYRPSLAGTAANVGLGLALAALWMGPYFVTEALPRPAPDEGFDPLQAGADAVWAVLALRLVGFALVTPVFEELFIRSFVMRYAEVFDGRGDFRDIPIARFTWRSFWMTTVFFTLGHHLWEYPVAVPWVMLTNWWFYRRGQLMDVVVVHAVTNASILIACVIGAARWPDLAGAFWIFA